MRNSIDAKLKPYVDWLIQKQDDGFALHMLTLKFNELNASHARSAELAVEICEMAYATMLNRMYRHPARKAPNALPLMLCCLDWPVYKKGKRSTNPFAQNSGMHVHAILALPHDTRLGANFEAFVTSNQRLFTSISGLSELHVDPIVRTPQEAIVYAFKQVDRGNLDHSEIFIFPQPEKFGRTEAKSRARELRSV